MKYQLTPLNEGHEMPCGITVVATTKSSVIARAIIIAQGMNRLLPGNDFACRIEQANGKGKTLQAWANGKVIDEETGELR